MGTCGGPGVAGRATGPAPPPARPSRGARDSRLGRGAQTRPPPADVLVLAGYRAQKEGELSVAPGDVVRQVCEGPARGWLRGQLGGRWGLFPERSVQVRPGPQVAGGGCLRAPRS